jgi:hypothetical protein
MPTFGTLVAFAAASIMLLLIPGPAIFYIVNRSLADGRAVALAAVAGIELGSFVHVLARRSACRRSWPPPRSPSSCSPVSSTAATRWPPAASGPSLLLRGRGVTFVPRWLAGVTYLVLGALASTAAPAKA